MTKLSDAIHLRESNVFLIYLSTGQQLIAKCYEIDDEKMRVVDPYHTVIMVDPNGEKSSILLPYTQDFALKAESFFHYKDILTIYSPKQDFINYYLMNLAKAELEKYEEAKDDVITVKKNVEPQANTGEKVIHVDFKTKKRTKANSEPVVVVEPEPDGVA